jgi:hypothetical protein
MPGAARSLVCEIKKHTSIVTTVTPDSPGIPRASGFNGLFRALLGEPGLLSPSQAAMRKHHRPLDISVGISGPHDFAVRFHALRPQARKRPSRPAQRL